MRIDNQQLGSSGLNLFDAVAQLRELPMADRSRVPVDEHKDYRLLAAVLRELD